MSDRTLSIHLTVATTDPEVAARATETLGRCLVGFALDGADVYLSASYIDPEEDTT
jgi:hypothetical protein